MGAGCLQRRQGDAKHSDASFCYQPGPSTGVNTSGHVAAVTMGPYSGDVVVAKLGYWSCSGGVVCGGDQ
jgi:hypothetical protein